MIVKLDVPDQIWADYVAYVEDEHSKCKCKGSPERHLPQLLATFLVQYKTEALVDNHHEELHKRGDKKEIIREHTFGPRLSEAETEQIEDWHAEYREVINEHLNSK